MKQRKKYPKTAKAIGTVAFVLFLAGFKAPPLMVLGGFLGLIAIILALGPDNQSPSFRGSEVVYKDGKMSTRAEAGYSCYRY